MKRLLIANRGEIACRIIRACKTMGIESIAIYSEADKNALHATLADYAICVGAAPVNESYLNIDAILKAAQLTHANAIHPGYGFLSENASFARAVQNAGLLWIGPHADTIEKMGDKAYARALALDAGIPVLPGSIRIETDSELDPFTLANNIGYPLLVKATGGGGGMGMKQVNQPEELTSAITSAQAIAAKSFGENAVFLEKFIPHARHIEVQIFGYGNGDAIHLYERDCSIQRRFQKVLEESPAPNISNATRQRMAAAAVKLAAHQRYAGPGTVEFIFDTQTDAFYFLEMNTRIQVEHPVTEMVTCVDLVRWQIEQALGTLTKTSQSQIATHGVAIECRLYAENPAKHYMPSTGKLERFSFPAPSQSLRVETGYRQGDVITPYYDPMIAKLICWAEDRQEAIHSMLKALRATCISGPKTNLPLLINILSEHTFMQGETHTAFLHNNPSLLIESSTTTTHMENQ